MHNLDNDKLKKKFGKKQNIQLLFYSLIIITTPFLFILSPENGIRHLKDKFPPIFSYIVIAIVVFIGIGTAMNWRCPACGAFLGREIFQTQCRKCKVKLK